MLRTKRAIGLPSPQQFQRSGLGSTLQPDVKVNYEGMDWVQSSKGHGHSLEGEELGASWAMKR